MIELDEHDLTKLLSDGYVTTENQVIKTTTEEKELAKKEIWGE